MRVGGFVSESGCPQSQSYLYHSFDRRNKTFNTRTILHYVYDVVERTVCGIYRKARSTSEPHNEPVVWRPSQGR